LRARKPSRFSRIFGGSNLRRTRTAIIKLLFTIARRRLTFATRTTQRCSFGLIRPRFESAIEKRFHLRAGFRYGDYNGTIPEKFNVVTGSHDVFVEYGNVGTKFSYIAPEGFGWMNASFEVGMKFLSPEMMESLREMKSPESAGF
jgi:hypothetical protein